MTQLGTGTLTLTGNNTYTGLTTISNGTLQIGNAGTSGSVTGDILDNAALVFNRRDDITYANIISGTGSMTQLGTGTLILTGNNTYTGGTTVSSGMLQIGDGGITGNIAGDVVDDAALAFNRSDNITFAGIISGTGTVTQLGTGILILTGNNTYTGLTTISSGTLQIGDGGTTGSVSGNILDDAALVFNRSDDVTFANVISGTGIMTQLGAGIVTLTGNNTYTGLTTISNGTLQIGDGGTSGSIAGNILDNAALAFERRDNTTYAGVISGTGTMVQLGDGALTLTGNNTYTGGTTISAGTLQIGNGGRTGSVAGDILDDAALVFDHSDGFTYAGVISGTGGMTQAGAGNLILTGNNLYTGGTTIANGTLQIGNGGTTGSVVGDILDNAALAFNHSDNITFAGLISGTGTVTQRGAATLTLTADNDYTGLTTISSGILQLGNGGTTGSVEGNILDDAALLFNRSDDVTYANTIFGSGNMTKLGAGAVILTGDNTYSGGTTISAGKLQVGNGGTTGSISGNILDNAALAFERRDNITFAGVISGSGTVTQLGDGALILTGNNTYTGLTTISSGILQIGNGGTTGSVAGDILNNSNLIFDRSDTITYGGVISGSGGLTKLGRGCVDPHGK